MLGETLWAFGMADFKELEKLVAAIQKQLAPDSEVQHNVKLDGRRSGVKRQIDVLVSQRVGQYDIRIIIDCKDHKTPIDVKGVEEFYGLFCDVDAHKGVLVCPAGFTKAAKNLAQDKLLDLYSPVDTGLHKWRAKPAIPAICDFREAAIGFGVQMSAPYPFRMQADFFQQMSSTMQLATNSERLQQLRLRDGTQASTRLNPVSTRVFRFSMSLKCIPTTAMASVSRSH
jgi:hypothetical protein